ncbi:MAG TPA: TerC/Alx family metal homeostasis membrane protein [Candidatus Eisenbacteria bacterium]|nr:TerC/Alx family metal homeostasis membrane protein [Candidatus Eisenbacteria bacterium]
MHVPSEVWLATVLGLLAVVALDLVVIARRNRAVTMRDATVWVVFYVGLAAAFAVALVAVLGPTAGGEFVAGYITEYSLSVDNLFVFVLIMARFAVPHRAQDKVLYIGIVVSMVLRAVCIAAGAAAIAAYTWVFYVFGVFLVYTAVRLIVDSDDQDGQVKDNVVVRALHRVLPTTPAYDGARFTTRMGRRRLFTPMVIVVAAIGLANVVFALDSIPAIFGLTQHGYIVFTANAFALMGLRQLYFLIGGLLQRIVYLNVGLSLILGFIGVKLVMEALHGSHVDRLGTVALPEIGIAASLAFIVVTLAVTTAGSLGKARWDRRRAAPEGE